MFSQLTADNPQPQIHIARDEIEAGPRMRMDVMDANEKIMAQWHHSTLPMAYAICHGNGVWRPRLKGSLRCWLVVLVVRDSTGHRDWGKSHVFGYPLVN